MSSPENSEESFHIESSAEELPGSEEIELNQNRSSEYERAEIEHSFETISRNTLVSTGMQHTAVYRGRDRVERPESLTNESSASEDWLTSKSLAVVASEPHTSVQYGTNTAGVSEPEVTDKTTRKKGLRRILTPKITKIQKWAKSSKTAEKEQKFGKKMKEVIGSDDKVRQLEMEKQNMLIEKVILKRVNQQFQADQTDMTSQIHALSYENSQIKNEKQQLQEEIWRYQEDNSDMRNTIQEQQLKNMSIQIQENTRKNSEIEPLRLQQENARKNIEIEILRQENTSKNNEIQRLRQENNTKFENGSVVVSNEVLGKGAYGVVYIGDFYGTKVAVKQFHEIILSPYNIKILQREINIASKCRHPNLLQFICAIQNDQGQLLIVTELMNMALRTLLEHRTREGSQLEYHEIKLVSLDVARGLNYLHLKNDPIIHRDISSANVLLLISENGAVIRAKVSDYGSANFMQACNTANPGAALYAAPEARHAHHDPKIDVFSYGILVCEMSICELPHPDQTERNDQIERISNGGIKELVRRCTHLDPQERPTMQDVIAFWQSMD